VSGPATWRFGELHPEAYRMLVEGVPAILYIDRPDERSSNLYTSPQIQAMLGFSVEEWMADPDLWRDRIHPDDRARVAAANQESNRAGAHYVDEYRLVARDGAIVWVRDEAAPVRGDDGTLLYWRGVMLDITERKQAEEKLERSLEVLHRTLRQRRELARRLQHAQEEERRGIAADIHDDPIQVMSAVDVRLQMLQADPSAATAGTLGQIQAEVRGAIERLRSLLFELRPTALDREGLVAAIRLYLARTAETTGWEVSVEDRLDAEPDADVRALIYRIVQEAIANARKHAGAAHLRVDLATAADGVMVRVHDDGAGFVPERATPQPGHLGLLTMVERAELGGGWARIVSEPGRGTTIECWLPASEDPAGPAELRPTPPA